MIALLAVVVGLSAAPAEAPQVPDFARDLALVDDGGGDAAGRGVLVPQLAAGFGAALVSVPLTFLLSSAYGSLPTNIIAAAVPALLLFLALPPLAVVAAEWFAGRSIPDASRVRPAIWWTLGAHVVVTTVGALLGVWSRNDLRAGLFTLTEAIVLPAVATWSMQRGVPGSAGDASIRLVDVTFE